MSYARIVLVFGILFVFTIQINRCSENTTGPGKNTPDTTSHDFEWQIYEFGGQNGSSILYDVAIVDENDIWAVGEIYTEDTYTRDSLGNLIKPYNAVHWDGEKWELKHVYVDYRGDPNLAPLKGVFALDNGEVVFSSGLPYLPTNNGWDLYHLWDMGILDENDGGLDNIWGTSISNLYFAGRNGTIVHYDGQGWTKLESGTDIDLRDIWGSTEHDVLWSCGYNNSYSESILLQYQNSAWRHFWSWSNQNGASDSIYAGLMQSVWQIDFEDMMIVSGDGVFRQDVKGEQPPQKENLFLEAFPSLVRGNSPNNVFIVGYRGMAWHYNGISWMNYPQFQEFSTVFKSVAVDEGRVVIVGEDNSADKALILIGNR